MKTMYKGLVNSPETTIENNIGTNDTIIYVLDPARVPSDLPNLMVLGTGTNAETIKVTAIEGNALTVERGFQGIAKDWLVGTIIARNFTEYDYAALVDNINELELTKETPDGAQAKADTAEGNAKTYASDLIASHLADYASFITNNAVAHNSIYRGKYLGSSVTAEQYLAISTGAFTDLYIGDYWTIGGVNYRIAAFDYYYNTGDTACTSHHVVIVPDTQLYAHVMNDTNITTGGYIGSKMYTEGLEQAKTKIKADFSGHVVNHRKYLCNAVTDGIASGGAWFDSEVELMNEVMVYGTIVNGHATYGLFNIGTEKTQLPLFALNPRMVNTRQNYWLRDVSSASAFADVSLGGAANSSAASYALGVRPAFSIS